MSSSKIFIMLFFTLSILDMPLGILGLLCMGIPIYLAVGGGGVCHYINFIKIDGK